MPANKKRKGVKCQGCTSELGKTMTRLQCNGTCKRWYHGKVNCTKLSQRDLDSVINKSKKFVCQDCANADSSSSEEEHCEVGEESSYGDTSDSRDGGVAVKIASPEPNKKKSPVKIPRKGRDYSIADVMSKLNDMQEENRKLLKKLEKQEKETKKMMSKMEKIEGEHKKMKEEIDLLKKERQKTLKIAL